MVKYPLPEELGRIVNAYAKPAFVHWRLFNEAKQVVPKRHVSDLREALSGPNADPVCQALTTYIITSHAHLIAINELNDYKVSVGDMGIAYWSHESQSVIRPTITAQDMEMKGRLIDAVMVTRYNETKAYRALLVEIHGEQTVEYAEYLDQRRFRFGWNDYGAPLTLREWDEDEDV